MHERLGGLIWGTKRRSLLSSWPLIISNGDLMSVLAHYADSSRTSPEVRVHEATQAGLFDQPWARTECCRLLVRYNSDAAEFALLNEVDKSNVGFVKCIVSHGRSGLPRFLAQPLVHGEPFFENGPPFFGQVSDRKHPQANALDQVPVVRNRTERLNRHPVPRQLRVRGCKRLIGHPIGEGQSAPSPQNASGFRQCLFHIRDVTE